VDFGSVLLVVFNIFGKLTNKKRAVNHLSARFLFLFFSLLARAKLTPFCGWLFLSLASLLAGVLLPASSLALLQS